MRLSSTNIRQLLQKKCLEINDTQFDLEQQIRPASVDVHISNKFWKFKSNDFIDLDILDLDQAKQIRQNPDLLYEKIELLPSEYLTLQPGDIVLTETLEEIKMPNFLSGALKGRSSFARLGISIHCTGDYINPSYKGHMPMQIVNHSPIPVKIYPYLKLAQLVFYSLTSEPDIDYQSLPDTIYKSNVCDTEGLSLWFRDPKIEKLALSVSGQKFKKDTEDLVINIVERSEKRIIKQLEEYLKRNKISKPEEIDSALKKYENKDVIRDKKMRLAFWFCSMFFAADLSVLIPSAIQVINTGNFQEPIFWISLIFMIFSGIILWLTFDFRFIGL